MIWLESCARDPVSRLVGHTLNGASSPEILFLRKAFSYLDNAPDDTEFAALFWQVVRLRCLLYRHVVQRPMTPGLQWFIRCYGRLKPCRFLLDDRLRVHSALTVDGLGKGLRSLEVRTSPESTAPDLLTLFKKFHTAVTDFLRAPRAVPPAARQGFEFGVVLHFIKDRGTVPGRPERSGTKPMLTQLSRAMALRS